MKWVYIPTMFALAFLYTKISFNNFQIKDGGNVSLASRKPGSVGEIRPQVSLYKVPASIFYKNLNDEDLLAFSKVRPYRGTIVGDVHVESFGYVIDDKKKADFAINDFNEVTEGALFHDVLGHLISAKSLDKRISWMEYFEAYKKGLRGESYIFSFYVEKGLEDARADSANAIDENITTDFPFEFTKIKNHHHHISTVTKNLIQNEMTKIFPKIQFFDLMESNSEEGTYEVLARLRPQDKIQWLELEENTHSEYDLNFNKENEVPFAKRFDLLKSNVYSGSLDQSLLVLKVDKKIFNIRYAEQFASKIKFDQIPFDDYQDIVMDEAYVLGRVHAKSLGTSVDAYIKSWATIPAALVDEKSIAIKYNLKDTIKNVPGGTI